MPEILRTGNPAALDRAASIIRTGGVVAIPTETFYGLAVDAAQRSAVSRIFEIKGRPANMALPLVAASAGQIIATLGPLDDATAAAAKLFWPGPLSLVVGTGDAVRVPAHDWLRALCDRAGVLTATSANKSGEPPAETAESVATSLGDLVDLIVDGGRTPGGKPSTIADLRTREPRLIREGAVAWNAVLDALKER